MNWYPAGTKGYSGATIGVCNDSFSTGNRCTNICRTLIDWQPDSQLWRGRGVTQVGASGEAIISNTKTTVDACHGVLREFVGVVPMSGVV